MTEMDTKSGADGDGRAGSHEPSTEQDETDGGHAPSANPAVAPEAPATDPLAEMRNQHLRLQADFDNFRRRTARDHEQQSRRANERLLKDLLPVLDHLDLGLEAAHKHHVKHSVIDGLIGVQKQFLDTLAKHGVTAVATVGQPFNPEQHECVVHAASDQHPENVIVREVRRGFMLGSYVLRAAQVIVSTGAAPGSAQSPTSPADKSKG